MKTRTLFRTLVIPQEKGSHVDSEEENSKHQAREHQAREQQACCFSEIGREGKAGRVRLS
jgi:succinyl-CoA synthetase beta subunit